MNYSGLTISNKNLIKRFSHSQRYFLGSSLISKYKPNKVLDYGAGDGEMFKYVKKSLQKKIFFFEPNKVMAQQLKTNLRKYKKNKIFTNSSKIYQNYFDLVCINEVFEHLNLKEQKKLIKTLKKISLKNCIFLISVPIEVGFSSVLKNLVRIITFQTHQNTNIKNIILSLFYLKIKRPSQRYNDSHIGFNYLNFVKFLRGENLEILGISYSPFNFLKGLINSQIFIEAKFK